MKILISNDDGINANGIRVLSSVLGKEHEVYVVAPDRERSAAGHSLTLNSPLRVDELEPRYGNKRCWTTTGTPGDCVKIALSAILAEDEKPDFVISGINHGPNLGTDVFYSGTVSCAMEGALMGIPSMAVSLCGGDFTENSFLFAANFVKKFLPKIKEIEFPKKTMLNVNVPSIAPEDIVGVAISKLGTRTYTDEYEKRVDPRGKTYYWLAGEFVKDGGENDSDINAIRSNRVSITPVTFDITNSGIIPDLENAFCKDGKCDWMQYDNNF
ncbi:MAG: 5'/3'-nucleotidase SurE [Candidatus Gastranaerophilales bacterium]|nr:5'/3'-nucleotidase SurE [Candidatus Gastranaerophilales bacterium]